MIKSWVVVCGDVRQVLQRIPDATFQTCLTSPPYFRLRAYTEDSREIGREGDIALYTANLVDVCRMVKRVLRDDGTLWVNLGDSYAANRSYQVPDSKHRDVGNSHGARVPNGLKPKDLIGVPWRVAFALQADGWYLRAPIVWHKPNAMPEPVQDRPTLEYEMVFLLSKAPRYYYNAAAVREPAAPLASTGIRERNVGGRKDGYTIARGSVGTPTGGRNRRSVWSILTQPLKEAHFAAWPEKLVEPMILAGSKPGDLVLDPFCGSGRTGKVAVRLKRRFVGIDLNPEYVKLARRMIE